MKSITFDKVFKHSPLLGGLGGLVLVLLLLSLFLYLHRQDRGRIAELEAELATLREQEKRSAIDRRVSKQMEEIAYGQQTLAEERSQEAIRQQEIAQQMTLVSEAERRKAMAAQAVAERSATEAMTAQAQAERQRSEADRQRRQAEHAKLVADTLNYISLGRTLGAQAYSIYQTGDTELGNMLAYTAYLYTSNYGGDLYTPSVFQALTQSAGSRQSWSLHNGSIARMAIVPTDGSLLTVSTYGEIFQHSMQSAQLTTRRLLANKQYCFRDVATTAQGKAYAISSTGHLAVVSATGTITMMPVEQVEKPFCLQAMDNGRELLIIGEHGVALLDMATDQITASRQLSFHVVSSGRRDHQPLLFDDHGLMHQVATLDRIVQTPTATGGQVTAFASSANEHLAAYGMDDGTIWLADSHGAMRKLAGHLSQVTKLKFDGRRLYSASYDGQLLFWMTGEEQIKPIQLLQTASWLTDFVFSTDKNYIWTGEQNGTVTEYLIALPLIAQRLRQNVKRNFTQQEWNYYVGKGVEAPAGLDDR